jgi:hypothetical protein
MFHFLASRWRMPKELAIDLAGLALYDIVILADDSSSMSFEEQGERIEDLKVILNKVAEVATLFDQDGITIRFLNSPAQGNGIRWGLHPSSMYCNEICSPLASYLLSVSVEV